MPTSLSCLPERMIKCILLFYPTSNPSLTEKQKLIVSECVVKKKKEKVGNYGDEEVILRGTWASWL